MNTYTSVPIEDDERPSISGKPLTVNEKIIRISDIINELKESFEEFDVHFHKLNKAALIIRVILSFIDLMPGVFLLQGILSCVGVLVEDHFSKKLSKPQAKIFNLIKEAFDLRPDENTIFESDDICPRFLVNIFFKKESPFKKFSEDSERELKLSSSVRFVCFFLSSLWYFLALLCFILFYCKIDCLKASRVINTSGLFFTVMINSLFIDGMKNKGERILSSLQSVKSELQTIK